MKKALVATLSCVAFAVAACTVLAKGAGELVKEGAKAPDFSAKGSDGKTHTIKSLTEKGPVVLVFIKEQCSANPRAIQHYNAIYNAYEGKVNMIGVINAEAEGHKKWKETFKAPFPVLYDPNKEIIHAYGVPKSQYSFMIDKDGKVSKVFLGFGVEQLKALNASLAGAAKVDVKEVDFSAAPNRTAFG